MEDNSKKNPNEIGVLWKKVNSKTGKSLWSGNLKDLDVVGFTFKTKTGREGMSVQISYSMQPKGESVK